MPESASSSISSLPNELILAIFCSLPSFSDVAYFAATCQLYHQLWTSQAFSIFKDVAPRTVPCRKLARALLADQGGPTATSEHLEFQHVLQLIRNARVVELDVAHFSAHYMRKVKAFHLFHGPRRTALSSTERHRFIRGLYQAWGFYLVDRATRRQRVYALKLKHLVNICELLVLYPNQLEEDPTMCTILADKHDIYTEVFEDCFLRLQELVREIHDDELYHWTLTESDGLNGRFSLWDGYQEVFKGMVLFGASQDRKRKWPPLPRPECVWDDTSDDERAEGVEPGNSRPTSSRCGSKGCCEFNPEDIELDSSE